MDKTIRASVDDIRSANKEAQNKAFLDLMAATDQPVSWAYEVWDELLEGLQHRDNHVRAIASQLLCNLAKSDPKRRMLKDFAALLSVTKDERFVTARHCLQSLWKVGVVGIKQQQLAIAGLAFRYKECIQEKNCTLIRYDIIQGLHQLYAVVNDEAIKATALALIETEADLKYRKKYASVWKK